MSEVLRVVAAPAPNVIPADPLALLGALDGPVAWRVRGRDPTRVRVVTTLLHGNEPSGLLALQSWLREGPSPAVDILCVIANVEAAKRSPVFTHRTVPGRPDLNRCFLGPFEGVEGRLARAILDLVEAIEPEALVDIHNNTGHNPVYGVGVEPTPEILGLCSMFGTRFIWSDLTLGALLEAVTACPAATIEVGKSGEESANVAALQGLRRYVDAERLFEPGDRSADGTALFEPDRVRVLRMPMRATIEPGLRLVMSTVPHADADLTMPDDLDRHNFELVEAGARIGWVKGARAPLRLVDQDGRNRADEYFERRGDELVVRRPFMPIMITTDAAVAASDCLFYVVHDATAESRGADGDGSGRGVKSGGGSQADSGPGRSTGPQARSAAPARPDPVPVRRAP